MVKAAQKIMTMGPSYVVIKKGEHGALLFHGDEIFSAPGLPLEVVFDPTGAGDTFAGGFMGYLAKAGERILYEHEARGDLWIRNGKLLCGKIWPRAATRADTWPNFRARRPICSIS